MPDTSQISPFTASCAGGLVLNKDVFTMHPGEALQLSNFEPDIAGGYRRMNGTTKYNSTIVPQVSASSERVLLSAIFNDIIIAGRGGTVYSGTTSGSWTSRATSKGTTYTYDFDKFNFDGNDKIIIATGAAAAFTLNTSYTEDIINATGGGTAPTNPKYVKSFANHMWYAGMSNATSTLQFSGPYTEDDFDTGGGTIIVGDAKDEMKFATITYPNGDKYTGEFNDNGDRHGQGKMTYANGTTKEGIWKEDEFQYAKNESTPKNNYSNDEELLPAASGTGFAVTSDGYVVTNNHVVQDCNNVEIYHKGRAIPAIVVNVDPIIDLAIIKGNFRPEKFYYLSTKRPRLRMSVDVIGYGFGKKISSNVKVTRGIISSLVGIENDSSRFQIDAAVQPGNSGGPIIDSDEKSPTYGNVIGVAVEKVNVDWAKENLSRVPENIAFGIKSGAVINFLDGNNIEYSTNNKLSDDEIDTLIHGGTYYLSCLMTLSQYEKVKKNRVLFSELE